MTSAPIPVETLLAHREWVRAVAHAVVRDPNAADDVEQETWLAALRTPPKSESSLRGWLGAVVRSRARRIGRGETRRVAREASVARRDEVRSTSELAEIAETHRRVVQAVVDLDEPYRGTILLRYFEGLAVEDVAKRTGVPLDTARSRISRGLAKLRDRLSEDDGGDERPLVLALAPLLGPRNAAPVAAGTGVATIAAWTVAAAAAVTTVVVLTRPAATESDPRDVAALTPTEAAPVAELPESSPSDDGASDAKPVDPSRRSDARAASSRPGSVPHPTTAARLNAVKVKLDWKGISLSDAIAELSEKSGVPIGISAELARQLREDDVIARLSLDDVTVATALTMLSRLKGVDVSIEEPGAVLVPQGVTRNPVLPIVYPPRADANAPRSLTLSGVVVDERGQSLPRVPVLALGPRRTICETDDDGSFSVELVRPFPSIYADVPGRVPSQVIAVTGRYGTTFKVRLELGLGGGIVEGHVVDADGRDAEGAMVRLTAIDEASVAAEHNDAVLGGTGARKPTRELVADSAGRFRGEAMRPGLVDVVAFAERGEKVQAGKAVITTFWAGHVVAEVGLAETRYVEVRLGTAGQSLRGTLRDEKGQALAGATVDTGTAVAVTGRDGSFAVADHANSGAYGHGGWGSPHVRITAKDGRKMTRMIALEPGVDLRYDPVLVPKWRIAGRVTGNKGGRAKLVQDVQLEAVLPWAGSWYPQREIVPSKSAETFAFDDVEPGRYRVVAYAVTGEWKLAMGASEEIDAPTTDLVFRVPKEWKPEGTIAARLVDQDGRPLQGARLVLISPGNRTVADRVSDVSGLVPRTMVPPGRYTAYATDGRGAGLVVDAGSPEIAKSNVDLGALRFERPGRASVSWTASGSVDPHSVHASIEFLLANGRPVAAARAFVFDGTEPVVWSLSPGKYRIRASGPNVQRVEREFVVWNGREVAVEVPLRAAEQILVGLEFPMGRPAAGRIRVTDAEGALVHEQDLLADEFIAPLLPGRYRVDVDVTETITVSGALEVPRKAPSGATSVPLR